MGNRLTLGSVAGIEIRVHRSWLFVALLIAWSFWSRFTLSGYAGGIAVGMAVVGAILFFASVLVHELAHSLEAQHRGVEVSGITLFLFGGATETRFDVERPRDEFALTAIGPFSSFVLAAAFGLVAYYTAGAGLEVVAEVAGLLAYVNLALGAFNLLPGAPLDGGRILRSAVWAVTGDRRRAVRVAARSGQVIGSLIAGLGLFQLFLVPGGPIGGLWFLFIGWFLAMAAQSEVVQHEVQDRLGGLTVGELVQDRALPSVEAATDLAAAAERLRRQSEDALVVTEGDRTTGVLLLEDVSKVAAGQRSDRSVGELAIPIDELPSVADNTELADAISEVRRDRPIAVTSAAEDPERVRGVITPEQLQRVISRTMRLGTPPGSSPQRSDDDHLPEGHRA